MHNFIEITATGSSYEIGKTHGKKARKQIENTIQVYRYMFMEYSNIEWKEAKRMALTYEESIRKFNPEYIEEIKGIAEGSGFEYAEILAINARSELIFQGTHLPADGCTSLSVTGEKTNTGTILGQNWDWKREIEGSVIMLRIIREGRPTICTITEAGILGKIGMNSEGIGVCFNALSVNAVSEGIPIHIILRAILEQSSFLQAMQVVVQNPIGCPANIMIGSGFNEAIDFEIEINDYAYLYARDGILTHSNHYLHLKFPAEGHRDMACAKWPDSFIRNGRADKMLHGIKSSISVENFMEILSDHGDPSVSICHHEEYNLDDSHIETVFSLIMDLSKKEFYISLGQPCMQKYRKFKV